MEITGAWDYRLGNELVSDILINMQIISIILSDILYPSQISEGIDSKANYRFISLAASNQVRPQLVSSFHM